MATNNVVKNVKARTAFKSELAPNWYKSPNFIPLPGELVFWDECQRSGYGWKKAADGYYYSRKIDLAQVTKTTPDSDIWNTTALTSTKPTEGTEKYYLDGTKVRTIEDEDEDYYVDENGYLYTVDATTEKEVYTITNRLWKKGGNNVPLLQIPVQDVPYIKDGDWWIGETDTNISVSGNDYILTDDDKQDIADLVIETLGTWTAKEGGY